MDRNLNAKELVDIEESVIETYREKGITTNKESIYEKEGGKLGNKLTLEKIKKKMTTLSDFQRILASKKNSKELAEILTGFLKGKSLGMFDCNSNINMNDACIDFDLSSITDEVTKFYASMVITTWITEKYMRRSDLFEEKSVYIDEAWTMLKYEETANFIENLARRARKRGVRLVIATQLPDELISSPQGRAILNCCGTAILMKQSPISVDKVIEYFKLSEGTRDFLLKAQPGEALLDMEGTISAIAIEILDKEKEMLKV
jgi:type IV secretory pathway VirB4 component